MLSAEQNERVTRTGPGTPAGALLRHYWQPAALVEELDEERPLKAVRLLGEDLVVLREASGRYGLLGRHCSHRGADLCFGRLEDGGLRCPFHGWLYDLDGRCLEQPAEPPGSRFHGKIRHPAYPCAARNGIVFAYLGPGEPPPLPAFDCFAAPDPFTFAFKGLIDCNWLQALEVGIDPSHASFLHRFFEDDEPDQGYGLQFRDKSANSAIPLTRLLREHPCPTIEVEPTTYGLRLYALRDLDADSRHVRITNLAFPNAIVIPMSTEMVITQWHVPIDDVQSWWYAIFTSFGGPVDKRTMRAQRLELYELPGYTPRRNRANDYGYDPREQRQATYTGMGRDINVHDNWAVESLGPIQDRSREHLGAADKAIIANRRLLLQAIDKVERGTAPPRAGSAGPVDERGPAAVDTIGPRERWEDHWREVDLERRAASEWAREKR